MILQQPTRKILLVDDDPEILTTIGEALGSEGYEIRCVNCGEEAISKIYNSLPDVIIIDLVMPDLSGYEVIRTLQIHPETRDIKTILMCREVSIHRNYAFNFEKHYEYVTKPVDVEALKSLIKSFPEQRRGEEFSNESDLNSNIDRLTGAYNETYIKHRIKEELDRAVQNEYPLSVLKIGVFYHEKELNVGEDQFQQTLLKESAHIINNSLRAIDIFARLRGSEFLILLPRLGKRTAILHAQRLRNDFGGYEFSPEINNCLVGISIGLKSFEGVEKYSAENLIFIVNDIYDKARKMGINEIYSE